jgi:hypothetical protein
MNEGNSKRITLSVRMAVSVTVDAQIVDGEVAVVKVVRINGLPSAREVMEALDADEGLAELDDVFENEPGESQ